jgi:hypothetical protein
LTLAAIGGAGELAAIAKRYHWRPKDLRHELENFTSVQISADA